MRGIITRTTTSCSTSCAERAKLAEDDERLARRRFCPYHVSQRTSDADRNDHPLERINAKIERRTDVVGIFPNDAAIVRFVGALLLEQNDERQLQRRYMQLEATVLAGDFNHPPMRAGMGHCVQHRQQFMHASNEGRFWLLAKDLLEEAGTIEPVFAEILVEELT